MLVLITKEDTRLSSRIFLLERERESDFRKKSFSNFGGTKSLEAITGPSRFDLSVSGGPSRLGVAGGRAF